MLGSLQCSARRLSKADKFMFFFEPHVYFHSSVGVKILMLHSRHETNGFGSDYSVTCLDNTDFRELKIEGSGKSTKSQICTTDQRLLIPQGQYTHILLVSTAQEDKSFGQKAFKR